MVKPLLTINSQQIPIVLKGIPRWICWRVDPKTRKKVPYGGSQCSQPINGLCHENWKIFDQAMADYLKHQTSGIGLALNNDGLLAIDLDNCVDNNVPNLASEAFLQQVGADYVEFSPSRHGLRAFSFGTIGKPIVENWNGTRVEIYAEKRFVTVTGNRLRGSSIPTLHCVESVLRSPLSSNSSDSSDSSDSSESSILTGADRDRIQNWKIPETVIPDQKGVRHRLLFELARHLKADFPGVRAVDLKPIVRRWHQLALPHVRTKAFEESWVDFCNAYAEVKNPHGVTLASLTSHLAELPDGLCGSGEFGERGDMLLRICLSLSTGNPNGVFFLSSRKAAELLSVSKSEAVSQSEANRLLRALVRIGALEIVQIHTSKKAPRYRFPAISNH